ncbi:MAG TPA: pyruvate kinase [Candidatus Acidoferrum sp.]|nr:pyruvate kinase [Candidatus Acidoferrum sp.]
MRKTKIVCTLGPSTDGKLQAMLAAGMNVARFNMSHGTHEEHTARIEAVKQLRRETGKPIALMIDTKGPEVRLGVFEEPAALTEGQAYILTTAEVPCDDRRAHVNYAGLPADLAAGARILIDDGQIAMTVTAIDGEEISCRVENGGVLSSRKSVNIPGVRLSMPYMSPADEADLTFAAQNGAEFVAASFVRCAADVAEVRRVLEAAGGAEVQIIAKIENAQGVENIDEIIAEADGIMVARGDMGVEIDYAMLPRIQKSIIKKCLAAGRRTITATQMLESMIKSPRPTRAEVSDVANAVYDGTSAVMLSGESSVGKYPVETVKAMAGIIEQAEDDINYVRRMESKRFVDAGITTAISHATCTTAHDLKAAAIVACSMSGRTARTVSSYRPAVPIICCTPLESTFHRLAMSWGVLPVMSPQPDSADALFADAVEKAVATGLARSGDIIVITSGVPLGVTGTTDTLKVVKI